MNNDISGGLSTILKDAPLPVRMIGSIMKPMLSTLAESIAEQQSSIEDVIVDAKRLLYNDNTIIQLLGEPILLSDMPMSQSSSTSSINGRTTSRIELMIQISGSMNNGIAQIISTQDGIQSLSVNVNGRTINIDVTNQGGSSRISNKNKFDDGDIIEAEVIDRNVK